MLCSRESKQKGKNEDRWLQRNRISGGKDGREKERKRDTPITQKEEWTFRSAL